MEAVCEVARPTWYRNATGPEGSPERAVWVYVWFCVLVWVWLVPRPSLDEWICGSACMDCPPPPTPSLNPAPPLPLLFLCLFPSLHLSLFLQMDTMDAWVGIALWEGGKHPNALACEWVDMWQQRVYMSLCVCVPPWRCFILRPTSQWFWMEISVGLFPGTLLPLNQLCVCVCSHVCICAVVIDSYMFVMIRVKQDM